MKVEELRIGNWIKIQDGLIRQVNVDFFMRSNVFHEMVKPIPLTEQWLERLGFEREGVSGIWTFGKLSVQIKHDERFHPKGRTYFNSWAILEHYPHYVHQLQNLFFALTGTELTIKDNQ